MFFDCESAQLSVVDVLHLETGRQTLTHSNERAYHALTLRKKADTTLFYGDQELYLSGKSLLFIPPSLSYSRRAADEEMIVIHFLSTLSSKNEPRLYRPENPAALEPLFEEFLRVWRSKDAGYRLKAGELLFRILHRIALDETEHYHSESLSSRAAKLMEQHAENSAFSVAELSPLLRVSGAWLRRQFQQDYQMSPKAYLTQYRLQTASSLLETGYFTVKEVARRSGFENEKYFATVFKQHFGLSPTAYAISRQIKPNKE